MSLSEAPREDPFPVSVTDGQPPSLTPQTYGPISQSTEEWIQSLADLGKKEMQNASEGSWESIFGFCSPEVTHPRPASHYPMFDDSTFFFGGDPQAFDPVTMFGEILPQLQLAAALNPTNYIGTECSATPNPPPPGPAAILSSTPSYPSTSPSGNTSTLIVPYSQPATYTPGSFARRWGGYQDPDRDNDPIVLPEISREHISITKQRERNKRMFDKERRERAIPRPRKFKLCLELPEDFGCKFPVVFEHEKPWETLKYPRDKSKDNLIENRHIHYPAGVDYEQWGDLECGKVYQVARDPDPTPEAVLNGTWQRPHDLVVYLPRPFEYCDGPTFTVLCSYKGTPGPNVQRLAKDSLNARDLDDYTGTWMVDNWYRYTDYSVAIQWPGYPKKYFKFNRGPINIANGYRYTILHAVAKFLWKYMMDAKNGKLRYVKTARTEDWKLKKGEDRISKVRLMAINYYRHVFFPILAVDTTMAEEFQEPSDEEDYMGCDAEMYED